MKKIKFAHCKILLILMLCTSINAKMIAPEDLGIEKGKYPNPTYLNTSFVIALYEEAGACTINIKYLYGFALKSSKSCKEVSKIINKQGEK